MQVLAFCKQKDGRIQQTYVIEKDGKRSFFGVIKGRVEGCRKEGYDAVFIK